MAGPSFYIIGAPKCGSDTLTRWLSDHPEICLPDHGPKNFHASDLFAHRVSQDHYHRAFSRPDHIKVGEHSPWYLFSKTAAESILTTNPDARFIVCLRNPIDLAWVYHGAQVADAREHVEDFRTAWAMSHLRRQGRGSRHGSNAKLLDYCGICDLGMQLMALASIANPANIHIVFLDDMKENPELVFADVLDFLEVDAVEKQAFLFEDFIVEHPLKGLHILARHAGNLMSALSPAAPSASRMFQAINGWNRRTGTVRCMPRDLREKLSDRLSDEIAVISAMTGRDLSSWIC